MSNVTRDSVESVDSMFQDIVLQRVQLLPGGQMFKPNIKLLPVRSKSSRVEVCECRCPSFSWPGYKEQFLS